MMDANSYPLVGFLAATAAAVFLGTFLVPARFQRSRGGFGGDVFFWFVASGAIWVSGLLLQLYRAAFPEGGGTPSDYSVPFFPLAAMGGSMWALAQATALPAIRCLGLVGAVPAWSLVSLVVGWTAGAYGIFGTAPAVLHQSGLNQAGLTLAAVSLCACALSAAESHAAAEPPRPLAEQSCAPDEAPPAGPGTRANSIADPCPPATPPLSRRSALGLCLVSGLLQGAWLAPSTFLRDRGLGPADPIAYVPSQCSGIFATSAALFAAHSVWRRGGPVLEPAAVLPALATGVVLAVALCCWFVASCTLSAAVGSPLVAAGSGLVASLWGVLEFKEARRPGREAGLRLLWAAAVATGVAGVLCLGLS
jgi:hypothetical protein